MTSEIEVSVVSPAEDAETAIAASDPLDTHIYDVLVEKGALAILWQFVRVNPGYIDAYAQSIGQPTDTAQAKRLARRFGLRRLVAPAITTPDESVLLPILPRKSVKGSPGVVAIQFHCDDDFEAQMSMAHFTLIDKTQPRVRDVPTTRSYTDHRLAFLLRVLHFHMRAFEATAAMAALAEMKIAWRDVMTIGVGRRKKDSTYTVRNYRDDIKAALKIRDELTFKLLHEARMSLYGEMPVHLEGSNTGET